MSILYRDFTNVGTGFRRNGVPTLSRHNIEQTLRPPTLVNRRRVVRGVRFIGGAANTDGWPDIDTSEQDALENDYWKWVADGAQWIGQTIGASPTLPINQMILQEAQARAGGATVPNKELLKYALSSPSASDTTGSGKPRHK